MTTSDLPTTPAPRPTTLARLVRWTLLCALTVFVLASLAVALMFFARSRVLADGRAAVATMSKPRPAAQGTNGFADFFLSDYDVPVERRDELFAAALAHQQALTPDGDVRPEAPPPPWPLGVDGATARPKIDVEKLCRMSTCLAEARTDPQPLRELVAAETGRIAAVERALSADHLRNVFPEGPAQPLPPFQSIRLVIAAAALDAVDGRVPQAYARTCRVLATSRRWSADPGSLLEKMVGVYYSRGSATQLLELRRHFPVASLPAECAEAIAPVRDAELVVCDAMRGEFRTSSPAAFLADRMARMQWHERLYSGLVFDGEIHEGWTAQNLGYLCTDEVESLARRGLPPPPSPTVPVPGFGGECLLAYASCVLSNIALPRYRDYAERTLDDVMQLRLLLAGQAVADGTATPRDAVAAVALEGFPVRFDDRGERATIRLVIPLGGPPEVTVDYSGLAPAASGVVAPPADPSSTVPTVSGTAR